MHKVLRRTNFTIQRVGDDKLPKRIKNQNKHKQKRQNEDADVDENASKQLKTEE